MGLSGRKRWSEVAPSSGAKAARHYEFNSLYLSPEQTLQSRGFSFQGKSNTYIGCKILLLSRPMFCPSQLTRESLSVGHLLCSRHQLACGLLLASGPDHIFPVFDVVCTYLVGSGCCLPLEWMILVYESMSYVQFLLLKYLLFLFVDCLMTLLGLVECYCST